MANGIPARKAMVTAGENVVNDVDEDVYGNDGAERHEAQEASAGDYNFFKERTDAVQWTM